MTEPTITPPTDAPTRQSPSTFAARGDAFLAWMVTFAGEITTVISWISAQVTSIAASVSAAASSASAAATSALAADASATAAAAVADAWVSGGSYTAGESVVYSPVDFQTYRAKTDHTGVATDPSADSTNWAILGSDPEELSAVEQRARNFSLWTGA